MEHLKHKRINFCLVEKIKVWSSLETNICSNDRYNWNCFAIKFTHTAYNLYYYTLQISFSSKLRPYIPQKIMMLICSSNFFSHYFIQQRPPQWANNHFHFTFILQRKDTKTSTLDATGRFIRRKLQVQIKDTVKPVQSFPKLMTISGTLSVRQLEENGCQMDCRYSVTLIGLRV